MKEARAMAQAGARRGKRERTSATHQLAHCAATLVWVTLSIALYTLCPAHSSSGLLDVTVPIGQRRHRAVHGP